MLNLGEMSCNYLANWLNHFFGPHFGATWNEGKADQPFVHDQIHRIPLQVMSSDFNH